MAQGVTVSVKGMKELKQKFRRLPDHVVASVDGELASTSNKFVNRAASAAPVDTGLLKNLITFKKLGLMRYEIVSGASYSAYVEFGTRSSVHVPAGLETYAAQFKRSDGTGVGMRPRPFFFPQLARAQAEIDQNLAEVVQKALSK